jgi:hypothetical protein
MREEAPYWARSAAARREECSEVMRVDWVAMPDCWEEEE